MLRSARRMRLEARQLLVLAGYFIDCLAEDAAQ
jgi:hypothetical protein